MELLDAALSYARRGWAVFPLAPRSKIPAISKTAGGSGVHDATTDETVIRQWWGRSPNANIGLACGPSRLLVIDLDAEKGGLDSWAELRRENAINDDTILSLTGGGGVHLLFSLPDGASIGNSAGKLGTGIDIRATGGYVVVPPSVHPNGHPYTWDVGFHPDDWDPQPVPPPLLRLLTEDGNGKSAQPVEGKIAEGSRNATLTSLAGTMRRRGMGESAILAALLEENASRCDPPLSPSEVGRIAHSVGQYEPHVETAILSTDWPIYTLADAYAPRDPLTYIVADLFSLPSLSIVYGAPGCLKSLLMADCALCVAAGIPWLESLPDSGEITARQTVQVPVLWVDFDNGRRRTDERIEALGRARNLEADAVPFSYACMPTPWLDASDPDSIDSLIGRVNVMSPGLVVVDNLGVVSGSADENSAEMVHVLANFRRLAEETGAAVVVIHHQRKATGFKSRAGETLRGHSSIEAALDLALLVQREEHAGVVEVKSTKTRGVDVLPFGALFAFEHKEGTTELGRARFWGVKVEDKSSDAAIAGEVLAAVGDEPGINKESLIGAVKAALPEVGVNRIRSRIDALASADDLSVAKGGKTGRARCYSLPQSHNATKSHGGG